MITYILKSSISLIILFGLYWLLLRKEKLFVFNRYFLILSILFSLSVPFISIPVNFRTTPALITLNPSYEYANQEISIADFVVPDSLNNSQADPGEKTPPLNVTVIFIAVYISGVIFFLIRFLRNIFIIVHRTKTSEKISFKGYRIILIDEMMDPCSFFSNIYLCRDDYVNGKTDRELLDHELEHIKQSHTIDIMLIELFKIFYWFNPVLVLYDRAIRINHEYLADNEVIRDRYDIESYAEKLLGFIARRINLSLTSGSKHSYTRQRLAMMLKSDSGRLINITKIAFTLCIGILGFMLLSFKETDEHSIVSGNSGIGTQVTQNVVRGIVMTEDGIVIPSATVKTTTVNDALIERSTDFDGRFTIDDVESGAPLIIEYRGFEVKTLKADFSKEMIVKLVRDPNFKDPVFVTVARNANFRNPDFSSANALVVIDGVIKDIKDDLRVKPDEMKSFRVLKDNEAMKRYGDKGKDGVVEITLSGNKTGSGREKNSGIVVSDSSKYQTHININHVYNKGEIIDIPVSNLHSVNVWTYHYLDNTDKKELRTISIKTRDYYKVEGTVINEKGEPLPGVKITATDNPLIETTDKYGRFEIRDVREGALLEFSLPKYESYFLSTLYEVAYNIDLTIPLQKGKSPDNEIYNVAGRRVLIHLMSIP
jgi:beta-lactamase regulating signal transducer with metallopeptidase domain